MLDDDGNRMSNFVVILNPSPTFVKYAVATVSAEVDKEEGEDEGTPTPFGESTRTMDSGEFVAMLRDQRIVPPQGHLPGTAQVTGACIGDDAHDVWGSCFRAIVLCTRLCCLG